MEIVNKWFLTRQFRKFDTNFKKDSTYENWFVAALPLTINDLRKSVMEDHGAFIL